MAATLPPPETIRSFLHDVKDPEVPVLDIVELGIVRDVVVDGDRVRVDVTPTYSGCPAMEVIEEEIVGALAAHGIPDAEVRRVFSPAWTTDWMSDAAKEKLRAYGIAPPGRVDESALVTLGPTVRRVPCPYCGSERTELKSTFGSTACKAIHVCHACRQPFEEFKAI